MRRTSSRSGPCEHPVAVDVRVDERAHAAVLQALDDAARPASASSRCQPEVETLPPRVSTDDDHALAVGAEHVVEEVDVGVGGRAEDDPLGAGAQRVAHRGQRAQPAAVLDRHRELVGDRSRWSRILRRARPRAVEVDDVQEARARLDPRARRLQGRVAVDGLLGEVALDQAHGLALGDVDGRVEDHAGCHPRAQRGEVRAAARSPAAEDFSGWNWTPKTWSRADDRGERARRSRRRPSTSSSSCAACAAKRVHVVEGGAVAEAVEQRRGSREAHLVPADVRDLQRGRLGRERGDLARPAARALGAAELRRSARRAAACPRHSPRTGDAGPRAVDDELVERPRSREARPWPPRRRRRRGATRPSARRAARRGRR